VACPVQTLDALDVHKYNLATVPGFEYFYPKYSHDPSFKWDKQICVKQDIGLPKDPGRPNGGCEESVQETAKITRFHP
jgi:hypothetical protein